MGQGFALIVAAAGVWMLLSLGSFAGLWLVGARLPAVSVGPGRAGAVGARRADRGRARADIMDTHPVAIPAATPVSQALEEYFLRYRWSWFPVVDEEGRLLGIARQERAQALVDGGEGWLTMGSVLEPDGRQLARAGGPAASPRCSAPSRSGSSAR